MPKITFGKHMLPSYEAAIKEFAQMGMTYQTGKIEESNTYNSVQVDIDADEQQMFSLALKIGYKLAMEEVQT